MTAHKFRIGARVRYHPSPRHEAVRGGDFVVARQMPSDNEGNQYRIESRADGHQRVVHEADLTAAGFADA
jgi:hypothetical protein